MSNSEPSIQNHLKKNGNYHFVCKWLNFSCRKTWRRISLPLTQSEILPLTLQCQRCSGEFLNHSPWLWSQSCFSFWWRGAKGAFLGFSLTVLCGLGRDLSDLAFLGVLGDAAAEKAGRRDANRSPTSATRLRGVWVDWGENCLPLEDVKLMKMSGNICRESLCPHLSNHSRLQGSTLCPKARSLSPYPPSGACSLVILILGILGVNLSNLLSSSKWKNLLSFLWHRGLSFVEFACWWSEQARERRVLKTWSLGKEYRGIWVSSFRASFQVKQKKNSSFSCVWRVSCVPTFCSVLCDLQKDSFLGLPYSWGIYCQIGKIQFYRWERMCFQMRQQRCCVRKTGVHSTSEVQAQLTPSAFVCRRLFVYKLEMMIPSAQGCAGE